MFLSDKADKFRTFVRFVLVWSCRFPLPLDVWEGLRFVIVALPGLFSYLFFTPLSHQIILKITLKVIYIYVFQKFLH